MNPSAPTRHAHAHAAGGPTLARFEGAGDAYAREILAGILRVSGASAGFLIAVTGESSLEIIAASPREAEAGAPAWLSATAPAIKAAAGAGNAAAGAIDDSRAIIVIPSPSLGALGVRSAAAVFVIDSVDPVEVDAARDRLEVASALIALLGLRVELQQQQARADALRDAAEVVGVMNTHRHFRGAAMALVNEIAARLGAERVSLGLVRGAYTRLEAVSHSERFVRAGALVLDIESAMEECVDQDSEIAFPQGDSESVIARQTGELARKHGAAGVLVLPLRLAQPIDPDSPGAGDPVGAMVIELPAGRAADDTARGWLRLALDLAAPRLAELNERDAWLGRRIALRTARWARSGLSPRHAGLKLVAALAGLFLVASLVLRTDRTSAGSFMIEASQRRVVPAPFDGYLKTVSVKAGDRAEAGRTVLGELDVSELKLRLAEARAQERSSRKQAEAARGSGTGAPGSGAGAMADAQVALAAADEAAARAELLESQIARAVLLAPIDGVVVGAPAEKLAGAPARLGEALFEVADPASCRVEIAVPDSQIAGVGPGQTGELAAAGFPEQRLGFTVESVAPASEVVAGHNVFKVRASLKDSPPAWLRPGMEGAARVTTGRASYLSVWTRDAVNWLRMRLWL